MIIIHGIYCYGAKEEVNRTNEPLVVLYICSENVSKNPEIQLPAKPNVVILQHFPKNLLKRKKFENSSALEASYNIWEVKFFLLIFFYIWAFTGLKMSEDDS